MPDQEVDDLPAFLRTLTDADLLPRPQRQTRSHEAR
jgi:hypothetical protein